MLRDDYIKFRSDADNDVSADSFFCSAKGYPLDALKEMLSEDDKIPKEILAARRKKYAGRMKKIDDALFEKAEAGDTKAAELLFRRFDGWNPKQVEQTNNYFNFADMVKSIREKERARPREGA